jgi:hypothetical protein
VGKIGEEAKLQTEQGDIKGRQMVGDVGYPVSWRSKAENSL